MSRVINPNSTGKTRNHLMRTSAEILRHLSQKQNLDEEARDMASMLVLCLREIDAGIESSAEVWEKRDYWMKAEKLRQRWGWTAHAADRLERVIREDAWERLPAILVELFEHVSDIKVTKFTRKPDTWLGAYERLMDEAQ